MRQIVLGARQYVTKQVSRSADVALTVRRKNVCAKHCGFLEVELVRVDIVCCSRRWYALVEMTSMLGRT